MRFNFHVKTDFSSNLEVPCFSMCRSNLDTKTAILELLLLSVAFFNFRQGTNIARQARSYSVRFGLIILKKRKAASF